MFLLRIIIIFASTSLLFMTTGSFAASWSGSTGSGNTTTKIRESIKIPIDDTIVDTDSEEKKVEDQKTEKNAQKIILEVYKIQWNKILKDMDASIEKVNPDPKVRIEIYSSIQKTLEFRKQKLEKSELSDESKEILILYIEYMISSIEKNKKNLG